MAIPVGIDVSKLPGAAEHGAVWTVQRAHELGMDGVFFRSALDISPSLDAAELGEVASLAAELGLYLEAGVGKVNPFALPETPEIRRLGDGDTLLGLRRMIEACARVGIHELWSATANYKFRLAGRFAYDRFRTDVSWADQLESTAKLMTRLAPVLRDQASHVNVETHEEIASFELVRLVEAAGPDAFGITFDTANVVTRGEHPVDAARRVAPFTRSSHVRDVAVSLRAGELNRVLVACGDGVIDWGELLAVLLADAPRLTLSIEGVTPNGRAEMTAQVREPEWLAAHPDLEPDELERTVKLADVYGARAAHREVPPYDALRGTLSDADCEAFFVQSADHLRTTLAELADRAAVPAPATDRT